MNLNDVATYFEGLLSHVHFVSIVLGVVISTGITQVAKYPLRVMFYRKGLDPNSKLTPEIEVEYHRWWVRVIAVTAGAVTTFAMWPDEPWRFRLVWAIASGLACPTLYSITVHFFPWLGDKASADKAL